MRVICPKCSGCINIGRQSRFHVFQCRACGHYVRGIHANIARVHYLANMFFTLRDGYTLFDINTTPCPFCGGEIHMEFRASGPGFTAPSVCRWCRRDLPASPARQPEK